MGKKVLVVGSGGREHALVWRLAQSSQVEKVYCAPGNAGIENVAECVGIGFTDSEKILAFVQDRSIDLTVIGQEAASEAGVADVLQKAGFKVFGPTQQAVRIESSKTFSKDLMSRQNIPTASFQNFASSDEALEYLSTRQFPQVIKADGLATGKGVIIANNYHEAAEAINTIMVKKSFGDAGNRIVVEDFLAGQEVSMHVLADGKNYCVFPPSQDHKQIYDGDKGPNTGGMGVIAPVDIVDDQQLEAIVNQVVVPALSGMKEQGNTFVGCLYPGLMIDDGEVKVLEFNARFGDPEAEVYMRLLDCDFYQALYNCASGTLAPGDIAWKPGYAISVVLASAGYPSGSSKGDVISGLDEAEKLEDIVIFHAGTARQGKDFVTAGGRVLNITATGQTVEDAIKKAYEAVGLIHFKGMRYRTDIGRR